MLALTFPMIDPIALQLGPVAIRWYSLAYVTGILVGWRYMLYLAKRPPKVLGRADIDDFIVWATLGVILGGRLGYVLFYRPGYYIDNPASILTVWQGGMSFHGGLLGMIVATIIFARRRKANWLSVGDLVVCAAPIGLFFGRLANFINGELYGRISDVSWAMVFPRGGPLPRHPSQLYEAALEGLVLFAVLAWIALGTRALERPGLLSGVFFTGYGIARIIAEMFRQPDANLGFLAVGATMGQLLSIPVLLGGLWLIHYSRRAESPAA
jgi:phosphatidylglycerol---prolipoprotein diacylglyceryl transferase